MNKLVVCNARTFLIQAKEATIYLKWTTSYNHVTTEEGVGYGEAKEVSRSAGGHGSGGRRR